jgi:NPCBM/NEW2 domain-containing protein
MNACVVLFAISLVSTTPPVFMAKTVDGRQVRGTLSDWNQQALTLREGDRQRQLPLDQLLSIVPDQATAPAPASDVVSVVLTGGSVIAAQSYQAEAESAKVTTSRTRILNLPPASVDHVRFRDVSPAQEQPWNEILEKGTDQDMLVIASGDTLDYLGGIVRAVREQEIDFELDGDVLPVRRSKVFGIRYYRSGREQAARPLARLTDDTGSTWCLQRVTLTEPEGEILLETTEGLRMTLTLGAVAQIQFAGTGLVFLSDLTADSYRWTPYFGREGSIPALERLYRPRRDMTLDSSPIMLDGIQYERGLALHSRTEMTYRLPEPFERFQALAGIDDRLRPQGNVQLRILGDDRLLYEATIAGTDSSLPIDVSLKGVRTLTIVADFGSNLDLGDHLILAEAKLLK